MSFASGSKIRLKGTCEIGEEIATTLHRSYSDSGHSIFHPLKFIEDLSGFEMLRCLTRMLKGSGGKEISTLLEVFLLCPSPLEVGSRTLIVCALIEGLVDTLRRLRNTQVQTDEKFEVARTFINSKILESTATDFPPEVKERWKAIIDSQESLSLRSKIQLLFNDLGITLQDNEKVFFKIRPKSAHGTFAHPYDLPEGTRQAAFDTLGYLTNIFNKLILAAANYKGQYMDYSVIGGQVLTFS